MQPLKEDEDEEELDIDAFFLPGGILDPDDNENESTLPLPGFQSNNSLSPSMMMTESSQIDVRHQPLYRNEGRFPIQVHDDHCLHSNETPNTVVDHIGLPPGFFAPLSSSSLLPKHDAKPPEFSQENHSSLLEQHNTPLIETVGIFDGRHDGAIPSLHEAVLHQPSPRDCPNQNEIKRPMNVISFQTRLESTSTAESSISRALDSPDTVKDQVDAVLSASVDEIPTLNPNAAPFTPVHYKSAPGENVTQDNGMSQIDLSVSSSECNRSVSMNNMNGSKSPQTNNNGCDMESIPTFTQNESITLRQHYHKIIQGCQSLVGICFIRPFRFAETLIMMDIYPFLRQGSQKILRDFRRFLRLLIVVSFLSYAITSALFSHAAQACFSSNIIFRIFSLPLYAPSNTAYIYMAFLLTPSTCDLLMCHVPLPHFAPHILSSLALCSCIHPGQQDKSKVPGRLSFLILSMLRWSTLYILYHEGFEKPNISPMVSDLTTRVGLAFCLAALHNSLVLSPLTLVTLSLHQLSVHLFGSSQALCLVLGTGTLAVLQTMKVRHHPKR